MTEDLADQSLRAIPLNGAAELPGCRDSQTPRSLSIGKSEDRTEPAMNPDAFCVHALKVGPATNSFVFPKPPVGLLLRRHGSNHSLPPTPRPRLLAPDS